MSEKMPPETNVDYYDQGFKIDRITGEADKLEYSLYLELAGKLFIKTDLIKTEIDRLINQPLSERENLPSETLLDMQLEISNLERIIKKWQATEECKESLKKRVDKLKEGMTQKLIDFNFPKLQRQMDDLVDLANEFIFEDQKWDTILRNLPKDRFADADV